MFSGFLRPSFFLSQPCRGLTFCFMFGLSTYGGDLTPFLPGMLPDLNAARGKGEPIWFDDPAHVFHPSQWVHWLPNASMTFAGQLNALARLCVFAGTLVAIATRRPAFLFVGIVGLGITGLLYTFQAAKVQEARGKMQDAGLDIDDGDASFCARPTADNPFMNPSVVDILEHPDKTGACDITDPRMAKTIQGKFDERYSHDEKDVFGRNGGSRQFYTVPNTKFPNDQGGFADWLYGTGPTCKQGNGTACNDLNYRYVLA